MGPKKKHPAINRKSASSDNVNRPSNGKGNMRSKSTIMRLNMYRRGAPVRNKEGLIVGGTLMMRDKAGGKDLPNVARIAPDRRWFGNTRTISQNDLDSFRENMTEKAADPYSVVLRRQKIPMTLLKDAEKVASMNLLETESYDSAFGGKQKRKRPKILDSLGDYEALMKSATAKAAVYDTNPRGDSNIEVEVTRECDIKKDDLFAKGQSKRIWAELYKVMDCSDVILEVIDARDVPGTRCPHIENHIKKNASHKHLVIVINKCDLVPSWVSRKWVKKLSEEFPTLAYHASVTNAFGKGALISLLRQFGKLHSDKRQISVGVIGYPNSGKSSVINSLMGKKCCKAAPIPGETKVWQYIALMRKIFLIDCPGVVYDVGDDEVSTVLKGVVRAERLDTPTDFIEEILRRVKPIYIQRQYMITEWTDHMDFLTKVALRQGKLVKGGEPDLPTVAINVINDWQRGKLPYFVAPPMSADDDEEEHEEEDLDLLKIANQAREEDGEVEEGVAAASIEELGEVDEDEEEDEDEIESDGDLEDGSGVEDEGAAEGDSVFDSDEEEGDEEEEGSDDEEEEEELVAVAPVPQGKKRSIAMVNAKAPTAPVAPAKKGSAAAAPAAKKGAAAAAVPVVAAKKGKKSAASNQDWDC